MKGFRGVTPGTRSDSISGYSSRACRCICALSKCRSQVIHALRLPQLKCDWGDSLVDLKAFTIQLHTPVTGKCMFTLVFQVNEL